MPAFVLSRFCPAFRRRPLRGGHRTDRGYAPENPAARLQRSDRATPTTCCSRYAPRRRPQEIPWWRTAAVREHAVAHNPRPRHLAPVADTFQWRRPGPRRPSPTTSSANLAGRNARDGAIRGVGLQHRPVREYHHNFSVIDSSARGRKRRLEVCARPAHRSHRLTYADVPSGNCSPSSALANAGDRRQLRSAAPCWRLEGATPSSLSDSTAKPTAHRNRARSRRTRYIGQLLPPRRVFLQHRGNNWAIMVGATVGPAAADRRAASTAAVFLVRSGSQA